MRIPWKTFAAGLVAAYVGENVARPMLVGVVRAGLGLQSAASQAIAEARAEASRIHQEAKSEVGAPDITAELRELRAEIAALRGSGSTGNA